jgi:hypothetical protein
MNRREAHVGILYEQKRQGEADANIFTTCDCNAHKKLLPRSYASDGDRKYLMLHVLCHVAAFSCTLAGGYFLIETHDVDNIRILVSITSGLHGFGILFLLAFAAYISHPTEYAFATAINFATLLGALGLTCVQFVLTVRVNSQMDTEHFLLYAGLALQTFAFSLFVACVVGLAANGGDISRDNQYRTAQNDLLKATRGL